VPLALNSRYVDLSPTFSYIKSPSCNLLNRNRHLAIPLPFDHDVPRQQRKN